MEDIWKSNYILDDLNDKNIRASIRMFFIFLILFISFLLFIPYHEYESYVGVIGNIEGEEVIKVEIPSSKISSFYRASVSIGKKPYTYKIIEIKKGETLNKTHLILKSKSKLNFEHPVVIIKVKYDRENKIHKIMKWIEEGIF